MFIHMVNGLQGNLMLPLFCFRNGMCDMRDGVYLKLINTIPITTMIGSGKDKSNQTVQDFGSSGKGTVLVSLSFEQGSMWVLEPLVVILKPQGKSLPRMEPTMKWRSGFEKQRNWVKIPLFQHLDKAWPETVDCSVTQTIIFLYCPKSVHFT